MPFWSFSKKTRSESTYFHGMPFMFDDFRDWGQPNGLCGECGLCGGPLRGAARDAEQGGGSDHGNPELWHQPGCGLHGSEVGLSFLCSPLLRYNSVN